MQFLTQCEIECHDVEELPITDRLLTHDGKLVLPLSVMDQLLVFYFQFYRHVYWKLMIFRFSDVDKVVGYGISYHLEHDKPNMDAKPVLPTER